MAAPPASQRLAIRAGWQRRYSSGGCITRRSGGAKAAGGRRNGDTLLLKFDDVMNSVRRRGKGLSATITSSTSITIVSTRDRRQAATEELLPEAAEDTIEDLPARKLTSANFEHLMTTALYQHRALDERLCHRRPKRRDPASQPSLRHMGGLLPPMG